MDKYDHAVDHSNEKYINMINQAQNVFEIFKSIQYELYTMMTRVIKWNRHVVMNGQHTDYNPCTSSHATTKLYEVNVVERV
jgi:hypothetical protein